MKILFVMPDAHMHKLKLFGFKKSFREAPLSLPLVAAVSPEDAEIKIVDESVENIPYDYDADLVAISLLTGTSIRGYLIAEAFRNKGIKVVLGGVHVTIAPQEAAKHADAIVIGPAEEVWPQLVEDFRAGKLKKVYREGERQSLWLAGIPSPRLDLVSRRRYVLPDVVHATRGCAHRCNFCSASAVWQKYYKRPVADVIRDIKALPGKYIAFNDVSLADDAEYAKELFRAMAPLKKKWGGLATISVARDPELMRLIAASGCKYLLIGFESPEQDVLKGIHKGFNSETDYRTAMETFHDYGISIQGCFVFGFDSNTTDVFRFTVDLVNELRIDIPRYSIYTPYPGTELFEELKRESRILSYNWSDYDTMHVVFEPKRMSVDELYSGFKWAYKETFKIGSIRKRTFASMDETSLINFVGNLTYKIFVGRLYNEERFRKPNGIIETL